MTVKVTFSSCPPLPLSSLSMLSFVQAANISAEIAISRNFFMCVFVVFDNRLQMYIKFLIYVNELM